MILKKLRLLLKHKLKTNQQKSQGRKWYIGYFHEIIIIIIFWFLHINLLVLMCTHMEQITSTSPAGFRPSETRVGCFFFSLYRCLLDLKKLGAQGGPG